MRAHRAIDIASAYCPNVREHLWPRNPVRHGRAVSSRSVSSYYIASWFLVLIAVKIDRTQIKYIETMN